MTAIVRFGPGAFYGRCASERRVGGLHLAELEPTVADHEVRMHAHDDAHLVLIAAGDYISSADGMPAVTTGPTLVLNPPCTEHRDRFQRLAGRFMTLSIPRSLWIDYAQATRLPSAAVRLTESAVAHAVLLLRELHGWDSGSKLVVQAGLAEILCDAHALQTERLGTGPAWLLRAHSQLAEEFEHVPELADLARQADLHPVYFSRAFRQRYGCSPGAFLRRCRVQRATALLHRRKDMPLAEIAAAVGYVDQAHFSNAFKRVFGITPGRYRSLL
jgi:AraC family transcriptional regulator